MKTELQRIATARRCSWWWIVVSKWMQCDGPERCMSRGSDNSIFIARVRF